MTYKQTFEKANNSYKNLFSTNFNAQKRTMNALYKEFEEYAQMQGELWDFSFCEVQNMDFEKSTISGIVVCIDNYRDYQKVHTFNVKIQMLGEDNFEYECESDKTRELKYN